MSQASSPSSPSGMFQIEVHFDTKLLQHQSDAAAKTATTPSPATSSSLPAKSLSSSTSSFIVPISINAFSPVCELKRAIFNQIGLPPHMQRLSLLGNVDQFTFPSAVLLTKRANRHEQYNIIIATYDDFDPNQQYTLSVDPTDTVLDLKFLFSSTIKVAPEYQRLYVWRFGSRTREECLDSSTLTASGIITGCKLRILFEYPSNDIHHGTIHRSVVNLIETSGAGLHTVGHVFRHSMRQFATRKLLGTRAHNNDGSRGPYSWITAQQFNDRVTNFAAGLLLLGLKKGDAVGVIGHNRVEWMLTDMSCAVQSFISVPLYDSLGPDAVAYVINHATVKVVVASKTCVKPLNAVKSKCPSLQAIILMDDETPDKAFIQSGGTGYTHTVSQIEKAGQQKGGNLSDHFAHSTDIYSIVYTSGTTGMPKGAILTHRAMVSSVAALDRRWPDELKTDDEVILSYLPAAHIYERQVELSAITKGQALGFSQGDPSKLAEDVAELKPTIFPGVPRVWQRMYDRITAQVNESNFIARSLFDRAYYSRMGQLQHGNSDPSLWDKLVFNKIANRFGGRLKLIVSGAAPISPTVAEFMKIAFVTQMVEGYGLTETCAAGTLASLESLSYGRNVGIPLGCNEIKLVDVPDMAYLHTDRPHPRGEIWMRGYNVFSGYYLQPDVTAETLTADGWFMTGDIGQWLNDGSLQIIDRKKNLFKLSQGEYIRPEHIEGIYKQSKYIANIYVHGDSLHNYLVALIVPNYDSVAPALGLNKSNKKEIIKDNRVKSLILKDMAELGHKEGLKGFEAVKKIALIEDDFSIENGLLTPTLKVKRHQASKTFAQEIKELYSEAVAAVSSSSSSNKASSSSTTRKDSDKVIKAKL